MFWLGFWMVVILFLAGKLVIWVCNSLLGILPNDVADSIRRWTKFTIALFLVISLVSCMAL